MAAAMAQRLKPASPTQANLKGPQSVTDYPLRTQTMLAMAAFALVVLVRIASEKREMRA